jgi:hypothetical protein
MSPEGLAALNALLVKKRGACTHLSFQARASKGARAAPLPTKPIPAVDVSSKPAASLLLDPASMLLLDAPAGPSPRDRRGPRSG